MGPTTTTTRLIADVVGFEGELEFDTTMPDGMPRELLDASRLLELGWQPRIGLRDGIEDAYRWFVEHVAADPVRA